MQPIILISMLLGCTLVHANTVLNYQGQAYQLGTDTLLYTEHHRLTLEDGSLSQRQVEYRDAQGKLIAEKRNQYRHPKTMPQFTLKDLRQHYQEQVVFENGQFIMKLQDGDQHKQASVDRNLQPLVIDAGFDEFVRQHWNTLIKGNSVNFFFAAPARQDVIAFRLLPILITDNEVQLEMRLQSRWLAWLLDPITLHYQRSSQRLLRYRGISNLLDVDGNGLEVDIHYHYDKMVHN